MWRNSLANANGSPLPSPAISILELGTLRHREGEMLLKKILKKV